MTAAESAVCVSSSSWSAEWCEKYLAIELLEQVDWTGKTIIVAIADNAAAVFDSTGGSPSSCASVDRLRLAYAEFIHAHRIEEFFVPAQDDSHATHEIATWQKMWDDLAKEAADQAKAWSIPFRSLLSELATRSAETSFEVVGIEHGNPNPYPPRGGVQQRFGHFGG